MSFQLSKHFSRIKPRRNDTRWIGGKRYCANWVKPDQTRVVPPFERRWLRQSYRPITRAPHGSTPTTSLGHSLCRKSACEGPRQIVPSAGGVATCLALTGRPAIACLPRRVCDRAPHGQDVQSACRLVDRPETRKSVGRQAACLRPMPKADSPRGSVRNSYAATAPRCFGGWRDNLDRYSIAAMQW